MKGCGPGWLTYSRRYTHISGQPSATGRAQDGKFAAKDRRSDVSRNQLERDEQTFGHHRPSALNMCILRDLVVLYKYKNVLGISKYQNVIQIYTQLIYEAAEIIQIHNCNVSETLFYYIFMPLPPDRLSRSFVHPVRYCCHDISWTAFKFW